MEQTPQDEIAARVGMVVGGKWTLGAVIGVGGSAAVYDGTHMANGRRVAIKVLHRSLAADEEVIARFQREGYIANKVGHPGAVPVLDGDKTPDGAPFLVMDRLEGASLTGLLERTRATGLDVGPALRIVHDVLDILAAAHAQGITHRDIKPGNVFLTVSGGVMLLDFGIARMHEHLYDLGQVPGGPNLTVRMNAQAQDGFTLGTPLYMAPEQARARWGEVDARSDLWAVGAVLFRMIAGRHARDATTRADLMAQAMNERPPKLADVAPAVPADVAAVVDRALEMDKDARWPSAREMQAAVREAAARIAEGRAPSPRAEASRTLVPRAWNGRLAARALAAAAFVLFVLVVLAYARH